MPISWRTKTDLQAGSVSGNAEIIGTEDLPIITVFDQDVHSADVDIEVDTTVYILQSNQVPVANQIPEDPTAYILQSNLVPAGNQFPNRGDLVGWLAKGNVKTIASSMKVTWV